MGISLIIGILGFLGSCNKKEDNNSDALLLGAAVVQQQAAEAAAAEYNAQNNATNPDFYCEMTMTFVYNSNSITIKNLYPLPAAECNVGYFSWDSIKSRLIARIDSEFGGTSGSCQNTRNFIVNFDPSSSGSGSGSGTISFQHKTGQSIAQYLASAYNLNANDLEVISPAKYKSYDEYDRIKNTAQIPPPNGPGESSCVTAVNSKLNIEHPDKDKYCKLNTTSPADPYLCNPTNNPPKKIVLEGACKVSVSGSSGYPDCPSN